MADINANDLIRATAVMTTVDLSEVQNVYTMQVSTPGAGTILDILDRLIVILEKVYLIVKGRQNTRTKYQEVRFFNITQNIPLPTRSWLNITEGELLGDDLAHMTAGMFSLGVGKPGVAGRKFFGGMSADAIDLDGLWTSATVVDLAAASAILLLEHVQGGTVATFGIVTGLVPTYIQFQSSLTKNVPASQRRRRQGVGI